MGQADSGNMLKPVVAAVLDERGRAVFTSEGWLGDQLHAGLDDESRADAQRAVSAVAQGHCAVAMRELWLGGDPGGWLRLHAAAVELQGVPMTFVCLLDTTATHSVPAEDLGQTPTGFWLTDGQMHIRYVCQRFARWLGHAPTDMVGQHAMRYALAPERDLGARQFQQRFARATDFLGARLVHNDGSLREVAFASTPLRDADGRLAGLAAASADLTTADSATPGDPSALNAIAAISAASRYLVEGRSEAESVQQAINALGQALHVDRAYLYQSADTTPHGNAHLTYEWCAEGVPSQMGNMAWTTVAGRKRPDEFARLLSSGHLIVGNAADFPSPMRETLANNGVRSLAVAPVMVDGKLWGCVGVSDLHQERHWPAAEQSALRAVGVVIGASLANRRLTEERDKTLARLQLVLSRMPMTCITTDLEWRCTYWNPAAESLFGWRESEMLGETLLGRIAPHEVGEHLAGIAERLRGGWPIALSVNDNVTASGRRIICEWQNVPLHGDSGEVVGILSMAQDVTDRRLAQEREREATARFEAVVDASSQGIVALDLEGRVTLWNQAAETLSGYTASEAMGQPMPLSLTNDRSAMTGLIKGVLQGEAVEYLTRHARRRDGTPLQLHIRATPLRDANGVLTGALLVATDLLAESRLHDELQRGEAAFRAVVDRMPVPVCQFGADLRVTYANPAVAQVVGVPLSDVIGATVLENTTEDQQAALLAEVSRLANGADYVVVVFGYPHPDGTMAWCEWTAWPQRGRDGAMIGVQCVGRVVEPATAPA